MSQPIKAVALAGATGNLGPSILTALLNSNNFTITVLARKEGHSFPPNVTVKIVNTDSVESITSALRGQDAFIDATSGPDPTLPMRFIDAAVAAGVTRFIPSEFSADPQSPKGRSPLIFHGKNAVFEHLKKLAEEGKITYTTISNSAFLDWNLRTGFIDIDVFGKKVRYMNDGLVPFAWTMLAAVGEAVVNLLLKPEQTENKCCYISSAFMSQRHMADLAKQALGADGWEEETVDMDKALEVATERMMKGDVDMQVIGGMIRWSAGTVYSERWEQQRGDNEMLGVKQWSDEEIKGLIADIVKEGK